MDAYRKNDRLSFICRDPSPEICLLSSTSCHLSMSGCDPYPAIIHFQMGSITGHLSLAAILLRPWSLSASNPSLAAIHLRLWSSWFQPFVSTLCKIALIWAAFCDFSWSSASPLKVIGTELHNVRHPLTIHRSLIIPWDIIIYKKIPTHRSVHTAWDF